MMHFANPEGFDNFTTIVDRQTNATTVMQWTSKSFIILMDLPPVIKTTFSRRENDVFTRKRSCETDV